MRGRERGKKEEEKRGGGEKRRERGGEGEKRDKKEREGVIHTNNILRITSFMSRISTLFEYNMNNLLFPLPGPNFIFFISDFGVSIYLRERRGDTVDEYMNTHMHAYH